MPWDGLFDLFDDLEGQAGALFAAERDAEVADRSRAEYASVSLASRLLASSGRQVTLELVGAGRVSGRLSRVGTGWCLISDQGGDQGGDWLVPMDAIETVTGCSERAVPEVAWPVTSRLGLGAALRRLADARTPCVVLTRAGRREEAAIVRVGRDFVEAETLGELPRRVLLALATLAAVRSADSGVSGSL